MSQQGFDIYMGNEWINKGVLKPFDTENEEQFPTIYVTDKIGSDSICGIYSDPSYKLVVK